jgi:galactose mutarotase-like enzyme
VVNVTNHSYFNLAQGADANVLNHQVTLNADRFVAVDQNPHSHRGSEAREGHAV